MADQLSNQLKSFKEYMFGTNRDVDNHPLDYGYLLYCVRFTQSHGIYPMSSGSYPDIHRENDSPCPLLNPGYWNESFALNHQDVDPSESDSQCPDPYTSSTFAETYHTRHGHNRDNHLSPYLDTTATDLDYSEHEDNFSISEDDDESASHDYYPPDLDFSRHDDNSFMSNDDDRRVNPDYPPDSQYPASDPVGYDPTTQPLSDDMHATPAPISLSDDLHSAPVRTKLQRKAKLPGKEKLPGKVNLSKKVLQPRHPSSTNGIGDKFLAVLHNYDPLWAQNDRSSVLAFRSKMKFEELFLDGVIRKGDKLVINYSHVFLEDFDNEVATLTVCDFSTQGDTSTHPFICPL